MAILGGFGCANQALCWLIPAARAVARAFSRTQPNARHRHCHNVAVGPVLEPIALKITLHPALNRPRQLDAVRREVRLERWVVCTSKNDSGQSIHESELCPRLARQGSQRLPEVFTGGSRYPSIRDAGEPTSTSVRMYSEMKNILLNK